MVKVVKAIVVGDGAVGKTALTLAFVEKTFLTVSIPTILNTYKSKIEIDDKEIELIIQDTSGADDNDRLRRLAYPETDVALICYSISKRNSMENVNNKWVPEVRNGCGNIPIILVGTMADLRSYADEKNSLMTPDDGTKLREDIKATLYIETSAKNNQRVDDVFLEAARIGKQRRRKKASQCNPS